MEVTVDARPEIPVRVMTYNVHRCRGLDRRWMPERIASVIASCEPDIVALQELDVRRIRSGNVDQAQLIAHLLEMSVHFFPAMRVMEEQYGDAILSRWPARLKKAEALPGFHGIPGFEPRGALWAEISVRGASLQVINTHLGLLRAERRKQIEALLGPEWLGHPDLADPVVFAGDLNTTPGARSYRLLAERLTDAQRALGGAAHNAATFPSRFPTLAIDHIFVSASVKVMRAEAVRTPLARVASDHLPLLADLCILEARAIDSQYGAAVSSNRAIAGASARFADA